MRKRRCPIPQPDAECWSCPTGWTTAPDLPVMRDAPEFLSEPWLRRGVLTLVSGLPEAGKTSLLLRLAAGVTTATQLDGRPLREPGRVILCCAEDGYHRDLAPRLRLLGAHEGRLVVPHRSESDGSIPLRLPSGLPELGKVFAATGAVLLLLDPAAAYCDSADLNNETATRSILDGLQELAMRLNVAVITTRNFNKRQTGSLLSRINGSAAWRDVPRSILCAIRHPSDPTRRVLIHAKHSGTAGAPPLEYTIEVGTGHALFVPGQNVPLTAEDCEESSSSPADRAEYRAAHVLVAGLIGDGWCKVALIYNQAQAGGVSKAKLWRAKEELRIPHRRIGWGPGSYIEWGPPPDGWPAELKPGGNSLYILPTETLLPPSPPQPRKKRAKGGGGG